MPRLARLDAPGVLHHIIIRGIERRKIFRDDKDKDNFVDRLSILLPETQKPVIPGLLCQILRIFYFEVAVQVYRP